MRNLAILALLVASPAHAERPADLLGVVDSAPPLAELTAWAKVLTKLSPATPAPTPDVLPTLVGKLVGAPRLDGIDYAKPIHLLFLNPQKYSQPIVLLVPVKKAQALKTSAKTAKIFVAASPGWAVLGAEPAVQSVLAFARAIPKTLPPPHGIHGTLFVEPVWSAFGTMILAGSAVLKTQLAQPQAAAQTGGLSADAIGSIFDLLIDGMQQSERLGLDLVADDGVVEMGLSLDAKPDTKLDGFIRVQKPSDFALAAKLRNRNAPVLMTGHMDFLPMRDWMIDWMAGKKGIDPKSRAALEELYGLFNGDMAMAGQLAEVDKMDAEYLVGVKDAKRALELYPKTLELFSRMGVLGGAMKMVSKMLAPFQYDGLSVGQAEVSYDVTGMPGWKGPMQWKALNVWTAFDGMVAFSMGPNASAGIRKLIDSARHGKEALQLDAAAQKGLDRARAQKASMWMRMDLSAMPQPTPNQVPAGFSPTIAIAFDNHTARMTMRLGDGVQPAAPPASTPAQ